MVYIISSIVRKAFEKHELISGEPKFDEYWKHLMLTPQDYSQNAIFNENTKKIMDKIEFVHGGKEYDEKYPEGIPTSIQLQTVDGTNFDSGMILFPGGHSKNTTVDTEGILRHKFKQLGKLALEK